MVAITKFDHYRRFTTSAYLAFSSFSPLFSKRALCDLNTFTESGLKTAWKLAVQAKFSPWILTEISNKYIQYSVHFRSKFSPILLNVYGLNVNWNGLNNEFGELSVHFQSRFRVCIIFAICRPLEVKIVSFWKERFWNKKFKQWDSDHTSHDVHGPVYHWRVIFSGYQEEKTLVGPSEEKQVLGGRLIELLKEDRGDRKLSFGQFGATFLLGVILLLYSVLKDVLN